MTKRKEYLRAQDMGPDFYEGALDETIIPHREVLDFMARVDHEMVPNMASGAILRKIVKLPAKGRAAITGFADKSVAIGMSEAREEMVEPYHIKNWVPHNIRHPGYQPGANGGQPTLDQFAAAMGAEQLEQYRLNLVVECAISMLVNRRFTYMDGPTIDDSDFIINVNYETEIAILPAPVGDDFSNPDTVKWRKEMRLAKSNYRALDGIDFPFTVAFVSAQTAATLMDIDSMIAPYVPLQSSDPDRFAETYDAFMVDGVTFIVWHKDYINPDGESAPIPEGMALVTVPTDPLTGQPPIEWHSAANKLNRGDATGPYYDTKVERDGELPEIGPKLYDNGIPTPSRRNLIAQWQMYPTPPS